MLRWSTPSRKADPLLLKQIDINGDGEVSMEELQQTVEEDNFRPRRPFNYKGCDDKELAWYSGAGDAATADVLRGYDSVPLRPGTPSATSWPSSIGNGWRKKNGNGA